MNDVIRTSNEKLIDDFAAAVRSEYANSTPYTRRELDETRAALLAERNTIETRAPQRYALGAEGDICGAIPVMNEEAAGDWVHWGDVKHLFEANAQKASEPLPRCDCDPDFGCRKLDPAQFICCLDEMEHKAAASSEGSVDV